MFQFYSLFNFYFSINSNVKINTLNIQISSETITDIINSTTFNVVLDCSDNVPTRYLLNDICVQNKLPLVSGSALQMDGQLTVYNFKGGPCYRCLFPDPPPKETVMNCGDAGVLGAGKLSSIKFQMGLKFSLWNLVSVYVKNTFSLIKYFILLVI